MLTALALLALLGQGIPTEAEAKKAEAKLADKPDDPAANLIVGKYLAWAKSDWEGAGPFIERSSDPILKKAFQADAADRKTGPEMIGVGDEWVVAGDKRTELKKACRERATYWYAKAWPLVEGLPRERLREKAFSVSRFPYSRKELRQIARIPSFWVGSKEACCSVDADFSVEGRFSVRLFPTGKEADQWYAHIQSEQEAPPPAGAKLEVEATVFANRTEKDGVFYVRYFGFDGRLVSEHGPSLDPDFPFWKVYSFSSVVPEGAVRMDVVFRQKSPTGATWVDRVKVMSGQKEYVKNGSFER